MNNKFSTFNPTNSASQSSNMQYNNLHNIDTSNYNENIKNMEEKIDAYSTLSKGELLQEFLKQTALQKQSGNLNDDKINMYRKTIFPYLNDSQKETFETLMGAVQDVRKDW